MTVTHSLILNALIAGIGIALVAGPLGCFIIWRRMAYFGDALAHSTLFGLSLALIFHINAYFGLIISCVLVVILLGIISKQKKIGFDAILGILSHSLLALGLIVAHSIQGARLDLLSFLYGDILTINTQDLYWILGVNIIVLGSIYFNWKSIVNICVSEELASVEGVKVEKTKWLVFLLMALVFAIAVKLVGVLLITALMIIPAAGARFIAKSPEQMCLLAMLIGIFAVVLGLQASSIWDWPVGPAIVVASMLIFVLSFVIRSFGFRN